MRSRPSSILFIILSTFSKKFGVTQKEGTRLSVTVLTSFQESMKIT